MAIDSAVNAMGGAVSDIFAGYGQLTAGDLKAQGLQITAQGTRMAAAGTMIGAQETRLTAEGLTVKAAGDLAEAQGYDLASVLARQNEAYTVQSTAIQQHQLDRQISATIGGQKADVAAAGLKQSGSAVYLLADSARQGALAKDVLARQGVITEAGYEEQAKSYDTMSAAARMAYAGEMDIAGKTAAIAPEQEAIAQGQMQIAQAQDNLAPQVQDAAKTAATGDFIAGAIKGVTAVASIALAVPTGGASLLAGGAITGGMGIGSPGGTQTGSLY